MALNVLIVDDSDIVRSMIIRTMDLAGIELGDVHEAGNGKEALAVLDRAWIDLVLADVNMPVMDGVEMIEQMRATPDTAAVPVIVVSTEGASERVDEMLEKGVTMWIRKPFTPEEIREAIEGFIATHGVEHHDQMVADVFTRVAERFAFVTPELVPAVEAGAPTEPILLAQLGLSGPVSGTIALAGGADLCSELAANAMGCEPDEESFARGGDVLGELLNLIGGHVATELQADTPIQLSPPVVTRMARDGWELMTTDSGCGTYLVEDRPMLLGLWLRTHSDAIA